MASLLTTNPTLIYFSASSCSPSTTTSSCSPASSTSDDFLNNLQLSTMFVDEPKRGRIKKCGKQVLCLVCENEISTVSYFGVRICTGCRAFFRRSVKCQKTYQCLNNDLCGYGKDISNRLACKFCRFQRCVDVGMLDKKLQLHSNHSERHKDSDSAFPLVQLNVFIGDNLCTVLSEFTLLRRQISYERYNTYRGKETKFALKEARSALHDWFIGIYEFDLLDNVGRRCEKLFSQIENDDWEELMTADFSMIWIMFTQIHNTMRHQGSDEGRFYLVDESYFLVNEENSNTYWSYIYDKIKEGENKSQIYNAVRSYFLGVANNLVFTVCKAMNRAHLDEAETSALLMLLFTNPSCLLVLSDKTRNLLQDWKNATLNGVADHIERTGRNVDERMGEIIFLLTEFQNLIILARNAINLSLACTDNSAMPQKFLDLIERSNNRRLKARVWQKIFGDLEVPAEC